MKTLFYTLLFLLCISMQGYAQDINAVINQVKKEVGGAMGQGSDDLDDAEKEFLDDLAEDLDKLREQTDMDDEFGQIKNCWASMALYVSSFYELQRKTENESDCFKKYDYYGLQELMLLNSTSIMFCTEEIWNILNYTGNDKDIILKNLVYITHLTNYINGIPMSYEREDFDNDIDFIIARVFFTYEISDQPMHVYLRFLKEAQHILKEYFHPVTVMGKAVEINKTMVALPCSDGVRR
ncbi:hypothetical protein [Allomuricauda sp. F6463D]|uniref:hypothetical protein n=1 Tax=Allomuricauda sp. F6463D TaxID=2926409 RepID=UPI001FF5AF16|nr:hypothetical protein [Muricauda sp. F6463D]MCK0159362.1 hypothetical protein [Muricauda sp. F6463D]